MYKTNFELDKKRGRHVTVSASIKYFINFLRIYGSQNQLHRIEFTGKVAYHYFSGIVCPVVGIKSERELVGIHIRSRLGIVPSVIIIRDGITLIIF